MPPAGGACGGAANGGGRSGRRALLALTAVLANGGAAAPGGTTALGAPPPGPPTSSPPRTLWNGVSLPPVWPPNAALNRSVLAPGYLRDGPPNAGARPAAVNVTVGAAVRGRLPGGVAERLEDRVARANLCVAVVFIFPVLAPVEFLAAAVRGPFFFVACAVAARREG